MLRPPTLVFGVPVDDLTMDETVDCIGAFVERGRTTLRTHQVATVNVDFLVNSLADVQLLSLLQRVDLAVPDGMPIVWGSKLLGSPVRERVAGADLVPALAERCAMSGYSMYLFGGSTGIAERAADLLKERHPSLRIIGDAGPLFSAPEDMDTAALQRIKDYAPDILCVALGHPKQEKWIDMYRLELGVPVMMGVGGSLDFLVGHKRRAPEWMQRSGAEWLYRAMREPNRLVQRYFRDLVRFGPRLLREALLMRSASRPVGLPALIDRQGMTTIVRPRGRLRLDAATLQWSDHEWQNPVTGQRVVIDFREQSFLDHGEFCALVGLAKRLFDGGGELTLMSVGPELAMTLLRLRLYGFLPTASAPAVLPSTVGLASRSINVLSKSDFKEGPLYVQSKETSHA